jgi:meiotically up-regulated gene 157 (Mug157) protein
VLRVSHIDADRPSDGSLDFWDHVPGIIAACANRAVVTATRPSTLSILAGFAALVLSTTALSPAVQVVAPRSISITLPGTPSPTVLRVDADTLFHTIFSDFALQDDGTMYVQTGDIPAMWLRDSSAQTYPYVRFAEFIPAFRPIVRAVIERNARNVLTKPHANAFTAGYKVWEEKWEPDSLAYPVSLLYAYWLETHDRSVFTPHLRWALEHTLAVYACEIHHDTCSTYQSRYLANHGRGADFSDTGMIWGAFRPSDDRVKYPFNVPQNMFAAVALEEIGKIAADGYGDPHMAYGADELAASVRGGIERYGKVYDFRYGWIYAYEVDGRGGFELMDDANLPNLVAAPLWEYVSLYDPIYQNTRRFVLSTDDPYFYSGKYATGLGSPHTPTGWIWPLGMTSQALTSQDVSEVATLIKSIAATGGTDGLIHESFDPNDPARFTRSEFGWANAAYAELLFRSVAGITPQPSHFDVIPHLLPDYVPPIPVDSFIDQLVAEGTLTQSLRQSVL